MIIAAGAILFLAALYLFLVIPAPIKQRDYERLARHSYAHRGLHDNSRGSAENSMEAFRLAVERGYGIELDVQLTRDRQLVVFHDLDLNRAAGINRRIRDMDYDELKVIKVFGDEAYIPLFSQLLALVDGQVPLIVEIKSDRDGAWSDALCGIAHGQLENYSGNYCVESFDPFIVRWFMKNAPKTVRGQLSMGRKGLGDELSSAKAFLLSNLMTNFMCRPHFIAYNSADRGLGFYIPKTLGAMSVMWTVCGEEEQALLQKTEDAIIFEGYLPPANW
ncbi:MAG: glycerophosphodiester phosphodiesterase [Oscillospiraceae bacterium]|nr:glycerophosphodiester phosphodiesterase [Oscillospiraceae bacterium]